MINRLTKGKVGVGKYSLSKTKLLTFALVFAVLGGGYLVYSSFAAFSGPLNDWTAFKNASFGPDSAYAGSGAIFNRKCYVPPSTNGFNGQGDPCPTAWPDGSGIFKIDVAGIGKGFDFKVNEQTPRGSGTAIQIADINHLIPRSLPADFELSGDFRFPSAGNPNGFPPWSGDPSSDDWNVMWEFTDCGYQSNAFGIANLLSPKPRLYVSTGAGVDNQKRKAKSPDVIAFDQWYSFRYEGRLSKGSDGWVKFYISKRGESLVKFADWTGATSNPCDGSPYIEFGWYGMNTMGRTEVQYTNLCWNCGSTPPPPPPTSPTVSLSANPTSINSGQSSTLSWTSTNATSCTASNAWTGSKATSGTQSVSPTSTSTYTLTCTGSGGSATANATITVNTVTPPPPPPPPPPSNFTTSLSQGMTINTPYTWTFNPGESTIRGQFWADGNLLRTIEGAGPYSYTLQSGTLNSGAHQLGHGWDTTSGEHKTPSAAYNVTVNNPTTPPPPPPTAGKRSDLNGDSTVNILDLSILLSKYNTSDATADINDDGTVNVLDLSILLSDYGT